MSGGAWSPDQYEQFKDERSRPFFDLLALVKRRDAMRLLDGSRNQLFFLIPPQCVHWLPDRLCESNMAPNST